MFQLHAFWLRYNSFKFMRNVSCNSCKTLLHTPLASYCFQFFFFLLFQKCWNRKTLSGHPRCVFWLSIHPIIADSTHDHFFFQRLLSFSFPLLPSPYTVLISIPYSDDLHQLCCFGSRSLHMSKWLSHWALMAIIINKELSSGKHRGEAPWTCLVTE